jgi:E3 ubiquitin-protein ligase DRIP
MNDTNNLENLYEDVIKIDTERLVSCLKCSLCFGIFRTPFTINECMHTYCKACITKYFHANPLRGECPKCGVKLGGKPIETLIYDHSIAVLIETLFPEFDELDTKACVI